MEITSITVIESHYETEVEWALSFGGNNPLEEDYFPMPKETAFRLKDRLTMLSPIPNKEPLALPIDKF